MSSLSLKDNVKEVLERIRNAAERSGRKSSDITLVAVTKGVPLARIVEATEAGLYVFGENYVQEARSKIGAITGTHVSWHMIGHLQRNKAKEAVRLFDVIHTVDSKRLAEDLDKYARDAGKTLRVLVQVNVSGEPTKSGVAPEVVQSLVEDIVAYRSHVRFCGLMTMAPFFDTPERARPYFRALRQLRDTIAAALGSEGWSELELSMGMSSDFEVAIEEGATMVRVGTALFGERH